MKRALSGRDEEEGDIMTEISDASTLSYSTRIKGFVICFILGVSLSILGTFLLFLPIALIMLALFHTIGIIVA